MPSILVATGFVRIDADTRPVLKSLQTLGSVGGNFLTTAIGPAAAAASAAIGAVASSAAAAGAAVGVYGVAVQQQFSQITDVMQKKTAAEDADTKATNAKTVAQRIAKEMGVKYGEQIKITSDMSEEARQKAEEYNSALTTAKSATKAAAQSQQAYKAAMGQLPPATEKTAEALQNLKDTAKSWSDTLAGSTMPVFTRGIQFLTGLLPRLTPIVKSVAAQVDSFVNTLGEGTAGRVFREFGANVTKNGAGALRTFLDVARNLAVGFVGVLNAFMPMSAGVTGGLEAMTGKFATWGANLGKSSGFQRFLDIARDAGPRLVEALGAIGRALVDVASAAGPLSGIGLTLITIFAELVDSIPTPVLQLLVPTILAVNTGLKLYAVYQSAAAAVNWLFFTSVTASNGAVAASRAALIAFRVQQIASAAATGIATAATWAWSAAVAVATSPITLVVVALAALVAGIVWVATKTTWFQTAWKYTWNFVKAVGLAIGRWFSGPFVDFFTDWWRAVRANVIDPVINYFTKTLPNGAKTLRDKVTGWWNSLSRGIKAVWDAVYKITIAPVINYFTKTLPNGAKTLRDRVVGWWGSLRDGVRSVYNWIRDKIFSPFGRFFTSTIPGWARTMKDRVKGFFGSMRDGIGTIWSGIQNKTKAPINWVIDHVWNRGIRSIWGKITGWIGIKNTLGKIKLLASGGTVGNEPFGMFNRPTAIVGEGNPMYPEYVIPTDPKYKGRAQRLWEMAGVHFMADGGILGKIGSWVSSAASSVGSAVKGAADFLTDPIGKARKLLLGSLSGLGKLGDHPWVKMVAQLPRKAVNGLIEAVKKTGGSLLSGIGLGPSGGSGVKRWSGVVQAMLRQVGQPPGLLGITLKRMNQESGGNPTIVNKWDSNWQRGTPSVGLMQVIGPTFRSYAGKYRNTGPFLYGVSVNPAANIYASMKYALSRYGSLASAYGRPGGYELGTDGATAGWHWVGETGRELMKLPAGTKIRSARASARQAPAAASVVHLTVENHGVIGSKAEVEDWLVGSLETLRVKRRLPRALGGTA